MTALVSFVRAYAIWIYLLLSFGILFGVKVLFDAQRLARTTLFSLDQERAVEQTFRALVLIGVLLGAIIAVTAINVVIGPFAPQTESPIPRNPTATIVAIVFPSNTPPPTFTLTPMPPTETPFVTSTPIIATPTRVIKPTLPVLPTPATLYGLPAPLLSAPPSGNVFIGEGQKNGALTFKWTWFCAQCTLGPEDRFVVVISYIDKSGKPMSTGGGTRNNFLTMGDIVRGGIEIYQKAQEDKFQWFVQVRRGEQPLTPPSETWKFEWK